MRKKYYLEFWATDEELGEDRVFTKTGEHPWYMDPKQFGYFTEEQLLEKLPPPPKNFEPFPGGEVNLQVLKQLPTVMELVKNHLSAEDIVILSEAELVQK